MTRYRVAASRSPFITLIALVLAGCVHSSTPTPTMPTLTPSPPPIVTPPPPEAAADAFLNAWETGDYTAMYARLDAESQAHIGPDAFFRRYQDALTAATVLTVTTRLESVLREGDRAYAAFELRLDTALVGTLITDTIMTLGLHDGQWQIEWDEGLIWPQLAGGYYFRMNRSTPVRANIYDRNGLGLATQGVIVTIGVIPGQIEDEEALLAALALVTGLSRQEIRDRYAASPADWRVPIADIPGETSVFYNDLLASIPGIYREEKEGRNYPHGTAAPHVVGWISPIPAEQATAYRARGYRGDEWVGISGLEAWGEEILAGRPGGRLTVVTAAGEWVATVAESPAIPSRPIYTTFDRNFQEQVQRILGERRGAIVVLDVHTGAVLAMASGPAFDPNIFVGAAGAIGRSQVLANPNRPLLNRATQATYPPASVFKIITLAAALERGGMTAEQTFFCPGYWEALGPAFRKGCWKAGGHGIITLKDALTASCDVTFYEVGVQLDRIGQDVLPSFGRGFGFGTPTEIEGVLEAAPTQFLVPDPTWKVNTRGEHWWVGDTVNMAIGQGDLLVSPLQVARMMAAVANGGTLYRPYIIHRIGAAGEAYPEQLIQPQAVGTLPVSSENLAIIQEALRNVTTSPLGTASSRFAGLEIPVAGKTGTAEVGGPSTPPHSWFAAYAPADRPVIAVAVIVENAGEGSTVAAPIARQVIEAYFGLPLTPLPPQAQEVVTPTPQP